MTAEDQVLQADDRRFAAMRNEDWTTFDAVLADELTYCHSTARLETKAEHVANLKARKPRYIDAAPRDRSVRIHGDVGLVNGICVIHVNNDGKDNRFTVRYLAVYKQSGGAWRMLAWQSTRMPDA
jgi:ketosteroid isomerase-like protein